MSGNDPSWRRRAESAERRLAEREGEVVRLLKIVGDRGSNIIGLRRPVEAVSTADDDTQAISKLDIPVFDPNRNLILDPIEPQDAHTCSKCGAQWTGGITNPLGWCGRCDESL